MKTRNDLNYLGIKLCSLEKGLSSFENLNFYPRLEASAFLEYILRSEADEKVIDRYARWIQKQNLDDFILPKIFITFPKLIFLLEFNNRNKSHKIKIFQIPVGNKKNKFLTMRESAFMEGSALHTFGENFNYEGKKFSSNNSYKIYGTTINYLINQKILDIPDYIKIDVDGIEHEILEGANLYLKNLKIKSLLIELNKDFKKQFNSAMKILSKNKFKLKYQINSSSNSIKKDKFSNTFNFIFKR
jgi:FkbM family methyltransferase